MEETDRSDILMDATTGFVSEVALLSFFYGRSGRHYAQLTLEYSRVALPRCLGGR